LTETARLTITISKELDKRFRDEVARRLGMKKGNIQIAIEEAIGLWIQKGKKQQSSSGS